MWWLLLACVEAQPEPDGAAGACAAWAEQADVYGYCLTTEAGSTRLDVASACADAGVWEGACRDAWVTTRLSGDLGTDDLLAACGTDDCRFQVIDTRRAADLFEQLARCAEHAGVHEEDCVRHALGGWLSLVPDAGAVTRLQDELGSRARLAGRHAAAAIACHGAGVCGGSDDVRRHCELSLEEIAADADFCARVLGGGAGRHGHGARAP